MFCFLIFCLLVLVCVCVYICALACVLRRRFCSPAGAALAGAVVAARSQRGGKSTLLNLLHSRKTAGFGVGHMLSPETTGLWIWARPHPRNPELTVLLMDTEGLDSPHIPACVYTKNNMIIFFLLLLLLMCSVSLLSVGTIGRCRPLRCSSRRTSSTRPRATSTRTRSNDWPSF